MKMPEKIEEEYLAYCGINCLLCSAFHNKKNPCPGCRADKDLTSRKSCVNCSRKKCGKEKGVEWCFECEDFPCKKMKELSGRYSKKYNMELIQDGQEAKKDLKSFLEKQRTDYKCSKCGGIVDIHNGICTDCGKKK